MADRPSNEAIVELKKVVGPRHHQLARELDKLVTVFAQLDPQLARPSYAFPKTLKSKLAAASRRLSAARSTLRWLETDEAWRCMRLVPARDPRPLWRDQDARLGQVAELLSLAKKHFFGSGRRRPPETLRHVLAVEVGRLCLQHGIRITDYIGASADEPSLPATILSTVYRIAGFSPLSLSGLRPYLKTARDEQRRQTIDHSHLG